jgi:XTP/dITP diphosphohydrolase
MRATPRVFSGDKLILASHNKGKVREISHLLAPFDVDVVSAGSLGLAEPVEDGDSFVANAEIKALASAKSAGLPALADDSGLVVPALGGAPGIHSARWAGPTKDFAMAMARINDELAGGDGAAYFICVMSLAWPDGHVENFEGRVDGTLCWPPRGEQGFGYDPVFVPAGYELTFGEMDADDKHRISHRANAFRRLIDACFKS